MILSLRMHHIALIEDLTLSFSDGFHVMTGETGAGKSIVVDAVNLVLGGRADRDLIRTGTDKAWVEAMFDASDCEGALAILASHQIEAEDGIVTLYREITQTGRNLCRVCGMVMPVSVLREVAEQLMDVHGQHEATFLMNPKFHLQFLDSSGEKSHQELLQDVASAQRTFEGIHRKYVKLVRENEQKEFRMDRLEKSLAELKKAKLKAGEEETLVKEKERNRYAGKISDGMQTAYGIIAAGEGNSVLTSLHVAMEALAGIRTYGEDYEALTERCETAFYELEEIGYELDHLIEKGGFDPARAEQVEARLDLIRRLERKYGDTIPEILSAQAQMQEEYDHCASMDEQIQELAAEHKKALLAYRTLARTLTEERKRLAGVFEAKMMEQLKDLGMGSTVFQVQFAPKKEKQMPTPLGDDTVEFMISPNPGEPLKPLSKIASGGELSRLMLAIKSLEAEHGGVGCMVFDEIDTGISGRMAQVVAEKMALIATKHQVICVTHLPQIAAMAAHEFLVEKQVEEGRTCTHVKELTFQERTQEVARMIGGTDGSDESAQRHAAHMLHQAEAFRENSQKREV